MLCVPLSVLILRITKCVKCPRSLIIRPIRRMHHIQCLRQPHPVTLRLVPGISGRSKIAEMNLFRSPVAFKSVPNTIGAVKANQAKPGAFTGVNSTYPSLLTTTDASSTKPSRNGCREPRRSDRARWPALDSFPPDGHVNRV